MKKFLLIVVSFSALLTFFTFFFQISKVIGNRMEPTLRSGQTVLFRKYFLSVPHPSRGDIVLYKREETSGDFVGRVVGLPSESARIGNGNLYIDDNNEKYRVEEEYLTPNTKTRATEEDQWIKIGQFEYFITGDNRERSINIRNSLVHRNNIKGVVFIKF